MASVQVHFRDHGAQVVTTGIPIQVIATPAERQAIVDAIQLWSAGENDGADECLELEPRVGNGATSPLAQSGVYAYAVMRDNVTGSSYRERVPMPDLAKAVDGGTNQAWLSETVNGRSQSYANPSHTDYIALKTAMEAGYVSPNGNTAVLTKLYVPNNL